MNNNHKQLIYVIGGVLLFFIILGIIGSAGSKTTTTTTTTTPVKTAPVQKATPVKKTEPVKKTAPKPVVKPVAKPAPVVKKPAPVAKPVQPAPAPVVQQPAFDLVISAEYTSGYDRNNWRTSWNKAVDNHLGWGSSSCKYAFYETSGNCSTRNHRDHLVALSEAYKSGGYNWTTARKKQFYRYLPNLYEMLGSANQSKSDKDPANWKPAVNQCRYATEWIAVKKHWGLTADNAEANALKQMLGTCNK